MASDKSISKGQAWFCTTGLPSDILIDVDEMTFHLHKFPLMSKSKKLLDLITEQETKPKQKPSAHTKIQNPSSENSSEEIKEIENADEFDGDNDVDNQLHITLPNFPGGSEAFEGAAKFCYGVKIDLTPLNVAPLRCAGEYLQMNDEFSEDNLISKTERFFTQSVLRSIKDTIKALHSCEKMLSLAEELGIVERCIDAIATKASTTDPSIFGWPINDGQMNARKNGKNSATTSDSWFEELGHLNIQLFKRLIFAMKNEDVSPEILESCLIFYAKKHFPGISRINRKPPSSSSTTILSEHDQRELLEFVIANIPIGRTTTPSTITRYLFGLLRTVNILKASESCRARLEMKIGAQLDQATLDDLLIPSYSYLNETLYDVECIERILRCFLEGFGQGTTSINVVDGDGGDGGGSRSTTLMLVGKLVDGYLSEIASDANLKVDVFYQFAISLPDHARLYDDGLYRAVDVYLKAHPWLSEAEREKICGVLNCQKLTLEACTHAAQNERLPLRAVVQVLFFEQLQLRQAIAGSLLSSDMMPPPLENSQPFEGGAEEAYDEDDNVGEVVGPARVGENQVLRLGMDSMRSRVHQLERECSSMRRAIAKIDKVGTNEKGVGDSNKKWKSSLPRKFGCKFKTHQVCDSHEPSSPAIVQARKARTIVTKRTR
ncbi:hypothetical protein Leryth_013651 [Lithospermum erythrorhizon]|nr:hypothetical protein Leryth_013651 [Lithospermum erythrorhizon]